jgi:hypothetical protein
MDALFLCGWALCGGGAVALWPSAAWPAGQSLPLTGGSARRRLCDNDEEEAPHHYTPLRCVCSLHCVAVRSARPVAEGREELCRWLVAAVCWPAQMGGALSKTH